MNIAENKKNVLFNRLKALCIGYSTGNFEKIFTLLADDCVFESQWVMTPNVGKEAVSDYLVNKGKTLQRSGSFPECIIIEFVGNLNTVENAEIHLNDEAPKRGSFGLWYQDGKLAMLMCQKLNGETISVVVDIKLNEFDQISRIDLCMPELFKFKYFDGPFTPGTQF